MEELLYSTGGKKKEGGVHRRTLSIASGLKKADDVFSNSSKQAAPSNQYKYKKIDRNFKSNNALTGTTANYEYDAFKDQNAANVMGNGLYDFLQKTQNVSTPKS